MQQASACQETWPRRGFAVDHWTRSAPRWGCGRCTGNLGILFRLQFRRQAVDRKVQGNYIVGDLTASAERPLPPSRWIPGESHVRAEIVRVGCRLSEDQSNRRIIRNRVERLFSFVAGYSGPFIPQPKVEREPRHNLPIVLRKPVNCGVVVSRACRPGASQRSIRTVRYQVIDERIQRFIVPFPARPRQRG